MEAKPYLDPYLTAARTHGRGFGSLLWASPRTQQSRFDAIARLQPPAGETVLDVGCGRADFLDFCIARNAAPADYVGLEAVPDLADAAEAKKHPNSKIIRGDFVADPIRMFVGAELVIFSGSLNTLDANAFYRVLQRAYDATARVLVFNFLCSPLIAGASYLTWHCPDDVLAFARKLGPTVRSLNDYLEGDMTVAVTKPEE